MYWKIALHVYEGVPFQMKEKGKGKNGEEESFFPTELVGLMHVGLTLTKKISMPC